MPLVLLLCGIAPRPALAQAPPAPATSAQNVFLGGVPVGSVTPDVLHLSLDEAVARGLKQNLGLLLGEQGTRLATAGRLAAQSALLPNVTAGARETTQKINLDAYGFPIPPGTNPLVGPFNVFDFRAYLTQNVFDYSAIQNAKAGAATATAARFTYQDARDLVVAMATSLYLQTVTSQGRIEAARAQFKTAGAVYDRAMAMKEAGTVPGIEVLRAQVQMQAEQQRVIVFENDFAKQKLALARAIGLPLGQAYDLADPMPFVPLPPVPLEELLKQAYDSRADLQSLAAQVRAAQASRQAALGANLPSFALAADYGTIGQTVSSAKRTFSVTANVRIPIFEGGRTQARVLQADAFLREQRAQQDDLRARIEYEIRSALLDVKAADDRVQVARSAADLAGQQLMQARDRFEAGVTSSLEVVQAQEAVATATDNYLSSVYAHNAAKIALARAVGQAESSMGRFLGGAK